MGEASQNGIAKHLQAVSEHALSIVDELQASRFLLLMN
jgi:hypothetical protein